MRRIMIQASLNRSQTMEDSYLFRGDQYLLYRLSDDTIRSGPQAVDFGWPGLKNTQFAEGFDAAIPYSIGPSLSLLGPEQRREEDHIYIFKADQYIRYDVAHEEIVYGPNSIAAGWPGMRDAGFDKDLDAAFMDRRDAGMAIYEDTYFFFRKDKFVVYDAQKDTVTGGPYNIGDNWPGVRDAGLDQDLDVVVYRRIISGLLSEIHERQCYFVKGDKLLRFDMDAHQPLGGARKIEEVWPPLKGTEFASATPLPAAQQVKAHANITITFSNADESDPEPYGQIWLETKDGRRFRIWTQQYLGNVTPTRLRSAPSMDLPFAATDIASVHANVDEYDIVGANDHLAQGSKAFNGNGSYSIASADGSVTIDLTIT
jgi:hypothetical protein